MTKANFFLERYAAWGFAQNPLAEDSQINPQIKAKTAKTATPTQITIRVNTLKTTAKQLISQISKKMKIEKISYLPDGYEVTAAFNLVSTPQYLQGYFYIQEAASQIPAIILDPKPSEIIADLCCAPGSKTTQIAQMMKNTGTLFSVDSNSVRLQKVQHNLERCGVTNCLLVRKDVMYLSDLNTQFDKILLDAPCSGNFVIDADWFDKRSISGVQENARLQKQLIVAAFDCLKSGGTLVYSTCSLEKEENEEVVEHLLAQRADSALEPITFPIGSPGLTEKAKGTLRLWPSLTGTQGFFVAKIVKSPKAL